MERSFEKSSIDEEKKEEVFVEGKDIFKIGQEVNVERSSGKMEKGSIHSFNDELVTIAVKMEDSTGKEQVGLKEVPREEFVRWQKPAKKSAKKAA